MTESKIYLKVIHGNHISKYICKVLRLAYENK